MTQKHHKELKGLRKKMALKQADSISKVNTLLNLFDKQCSARFLSVITVYSALFVIFFLSPINDCVKT